MLGGTTYTVNAFARITNTSIGLTFNSAPTTVSLTLNSALPAGDFQLRIGIPAVVLKFGDAFRFRNNYTWSNVTLPGRAWVEGQPVPVQLRRAQGVTISNAALTVGEGYTRTYTVVLDSQPTGAVTVTPVSNRPATATVSPPSLTFNAGDWNTPQTVTVSGVSRTAGGGTATITHPVMGADYGGSVTAGDVAIRVSVGNIFWSATLTVAAFGNAVPKIGYLPEANALGPLTPDTFVFNGTKYYVHGISYATTGNTGLVVELSEALGAGRFVLRLDDLATTFSGEPCTLEQGASQCHYDLTNPGLSWSDGDTVQVTLALGEPEISIAAASPSVTEGSQAAFTVTAGSAPRSNLTVNLNITADGGLNGDYGVTTGPQTVTIAGGQTSAGLDVPIRDDVVFETDGSVTATLADGDGYTVTTTAADATATVTVEDDEPGRTLSHDTPAVIEGASGTTTVMSFTVTSSGASAYRVGCWTHDPPGSASEGVDYDHRNTISGGNTFSAADPAQLSWVFDVTVNGDDIDEEDETVAAKCGFDGISGNSVSLGTITDDDTRGITLDPDSVTVDEAGGTAEYSVALTSEPTADVTVTPASGDAMAATVSGALTFTPSDWSTAQSVTVTGVNDDLDNPNDVRMVAISHTASGGDYGSVTADLAVTVTDDDVAVVVDYDVDGDNLIEIANLAQLNALRWDLAGVGAASTGNEAAYAAAFPDAPAGMGCAATCRGYELTADLDFDTDGSGTANAGDTYWDGGAGWAPIRDWNAHFFGNYHTISNLFIDRPTEDAVGLFGQIVTDTYTLAKTQIWNIGLLDVDVTGQDHVGALVGFVNRGWVTITYATGSLTGRTRVGGLIGTNMGTLRASWADVAVTGGSGPGTGAVGGLVDGAEMHFIVPLEGGENGHIAYSYAIGEVSVRPDTNATHGPLVGWVSSFPGVTQAPIFSYGRAQGAYTGALVKTVAERVTVQTWRGELLGIWVESTEQGAFDCVKREGWTMKWTFAPRAGRPCWRLLPSSRRSSPSWSDG